MGWKWLRAVCCNYVRLVWFDWQFYMHKCDCETFVDIFPRNLLCMWKFLGERKEKKTKESCMGNAYDVWLKKNRSYEQLVRQTSLPFLLYPLLFSVWNHFWIDWKVFESFVSRRSIERESEYTSGIMKYVNLQNKYTLEELECLPKVHPWAHDLNPKVRSLNFICWRVSRNRTFVRLKSFPFCIRWSIQSKPTNIHIYIHIQPQQQIYVIRIRRKKGNNRSGFFFCEMVSEFQKSLNCNYFTCSDWIFNFPN